MSGQTGSGDRRTFEFGGERCGSPTRGGCARARPTNDEQVGAVRECGGRGGNARLVLRGGPDGAHTRGDEDNARADLTADGGNFVRGADDRARAGLDGERGQPAYGVYGRSGEADR